MMIVAHGHAEPGKPEPRWEQCGWGGGGFYYSAVFHPTRDGVIYLGGDVGGVYKTEDHGRNWRMINKGLANYGVFSLAVDRKNPETVYAATEDGLCKSTNGGESWQVLPHTGRKELRITGEKNKSIRSVAVDPSDGDIVYAASPAGKVFKSVDGGQSWKAVFTNVVVGGEDPSRLQVQFGKVNGSYFGGIWTNLAFPEGVNPADAVGFGFNFKGGKTTPKEVFVFLKTADGVGYRSRNLSGLFADDQERDVVLKAGDFALDPDYIKKNADKAASLAGAPEWSKVVRMDISCMGPLPQEQHVASFGAFFFAVTKAASADKPALLTVHQFSSENPISIYGNVRIGAPVAGSVYSVAVSDRNPSLVIAATNDSGLVLSRDKGATWTPLSTPRQASDATFDPADEKIVYGTFFTDGVWKTIDSGKTWTRFSDGLPPDISLREVVVSPASSQDVYVIGQIGWGGGFFRSKDAGRTWTQSSSVKPDYRADPTLPQGGMMTGLSIPTNLALNPLNPKQLYISANWRCCFSEDGGLNWEERIKGADISCITDIRFSGAKTYVAVMDEGTLMSENNGASWTQLWPLKHDWALSGHNWRVAVNNIGGVDRIISTGSPWGGKPPVAVVVSDDGGKTYKLTTEGLPEYRLTTNTMWDHGMPRALAVDPSDPKIVYLGIDGDPSKEKSGGGVFKSKDGGHTWSQLSGQPGSRRMYYGLSIDPTHTQRLYWAGFGDKGGVYKSEDGGESWAHVFRADAYLFNLMTTADGTVYASGKELYRSTDQGKTWKQLTDFRQSRSIVGLEVHPKDPRTLWISSVVWSGDAQGAVFKTVDGGATWNDMTGDIPYNHPQILRFNPETSELWAGFAGLFKIRQ